MPAIGTTFRSGGVSRRPSPKDRWDIRQKKASKEIEAVVVKTVASFLNSEAGGTLLVGVDDGGAVLGLEHDYETLGKRQNRDGFENFLTTLLLDAYGKESSPLISITFHESRRKGRMPRSNEVLAEPGVRQG